jgi:hypothetical protein
MQQHHAFGDEPFEICHLFLPEGIMNALRAKADQRSQLLQDLMKEQAERLLFEPSFFDEALGLADALWERLARGPSGPFAWPADPLVCVGGTLVFTADLKSQVQKDLLTLDDNTVKRLGRRAASRGVSYEQLVTETMGLVWKTALSGQAPPREAGNGDRRIGRRPNGPDMISRLDFTVKHAGSEPNLAGEVPPLTVDRVISSIS